MFYSHLHRLGSKEPLQTGQIESCTACMGITARSKEKLMETEGKN